VKEYSAELEPTMAWEAETDRFQCVDKGGAVVVVVVHQTITEQRLGLAYGPPTYSTANGERLERLDSERFALKSGIVLTRLRTANRNKPPAAQ
jgi:hypothetical protein